MFGGDRGLQDDNEKEEEGMNREKRRKSGRVRLRRMKWRIVY